MKKYFLNIVFFSIVTIFGASLTYFLILNTTLKNQLDNFQEQVEENLKKKKENITKEETRSTSTSTGGGVNLVDSENKPSSPAETYEVSKGETLYPIGLKLNLDWTYLAEVNNLSEPYIIKTRQILIIPRVDGKQKINQVEFRINDDQAQKIQTKASSGGETTHLDPIETAKNDNFNLYGLVSTDQFILEDRDDANGEAVVTITKKVDNKEKKYEAKLNQPTTKGPQGIWAIEYIKPLK